jgi:predicted TIM-barrel fold metal-dependent hydrolase
MLCAWWGPQGPLIPNDAVAAIVRSYPDRFAGVAAVDLARPMDAVRELRRCVRHLGFRALRVVPWLVDYLRGHGRRKVLFGSSHPAWPAADCLKDLPSLQLDDEVAELFLHANAERVFGLASTGRRLDG